MVRSKCWSIANGKTIKTIFQCDCALKRRRRLVTCVRNGKLVNDDECAQEPKPDEIISCYDECLSPHWEAQPWQPVCPLTIVSNSWRFNSISSDSALQHVHHTQGFVIVVWFVLIMDRSFAMNTVSDNQNQQSTNGARQMSAVLVGPSANGHQWVKRESDAIQFGQYPSLSCV